MAETIVNFVLGKLSDVVVTEVLRLYGVDEQVEALSRELGRIQAFLKDADKKQITDERQKNWVKEVRDVGYSIEDVIDTFLLEVSDQEPQKSCVIETVTRMIKKPKILLPARQLVNEIDKIRTRIKEIAESRVTYGINNLGEGSGEFRLPVRPLVLPNMDPDIVGFEADREHLIKKLLNEMTKRRSVVSIWGPGGLGKTTLALKLYNCNDSKRQFGLRIWVNISQKFEVIDILRKITPQLQPPIELNEQPEVVILSKIQNSLRDKKYLIVLDDVWTNDLWTQIGAAFTDENNGSRVLMTTRFFEVAKDADPICEPYNLGFLTEELSQKLLLKTTFLNLDPNIRSFEYLSNILEQFVRKCGGLPLALVVLGGLLLKTPHNNWNKVLRTMRWRVDGKNCLEIIATSYEDLPFVLKSCFLYIAAFPEDYQIHAPSLLQMWIAEGFIPQEDNRTLEETAESFLEDLVQRSMVQVKTRDYDGSIKYICIHDLLRDLALEKAKDDNFLVVYSNSIDQTSLSRARRVAIHNLDCDQLLMSQNLRTLLCFCNTRMPNCSKQRLLKVLSIGDNFNSTLELGMFEGLIQLRYLKLTGTISYECYEKYWEKVIGNMKFLETLDVKELFRSAWYINTPRHITQRISYEVVLPDCAWHIDTLRHVTQGKFYRSILGPPMSAKLTNLQTISAMTIIGSIKKELPYLPNLRTLCLFVDNSSYSLEVVFNFLATLKHLISFEINSDPLPSNILDMSNFPFYQHLKSLTLISDSSIRIEMALHKDMFPRHLTFLQICRYKFQQDIMPVLEKLCWLKNLILSGACENKKMSCSSTGFSQLEFLRLSDLAMKEWEIEKGVMPILKKLEISNCPQLGAPHGLKYLTRLQELRCSKLPSVDSIRNLCTHVPSFIVDEW